MKVEITGYDKQPTLNNMPINNWAVVKSCSSNAAYLKGAAVYKKTSNIFWVFPVCDYHALEVTLNWMNEGAVELKIPDKLKITFTND